VYSEEKDGRGKKKESALQNHQKRETLCEWNHLKHVDCERSTWGRHGLVLKDTKWRAGRGTGGGERGGEGRKNGLLGTSRAEEDEKKLIGWPLCFAEFIGATSS